MSDAVSAIAALGEDELITYIQWGGVAKQFKAIVERTQPEPSVFSGVSYPENSIVVMFPRDSPNGVMTVTKGKDRIRFKRNVWDSEETEFTVVMIEEQPSWLAGGIGDLWKVVVK